jgi:uncharacterized protein YutE (UPF0331/DUF86 family)
MGILRESSMLDRERILAKIDELEGYLKELRAIVPERYGDYLSSIETRRASERLLQIAVECVIDIGSLLVSGLRLGLPAEESDIFEKLLVNKIISEEVRDILEFFLHMVGNGRFARGRQTGEPDDPAVVPVKAVPVLS